MKAPASLQTRLLLGLVGAMSTLWLAAAVMIWVDARYEVDELLDAHLAQAAALLVAQQAHGSDNDDDDPLMATPTLHRYTRQVAFQVWHRGLLSLRSPNAPLAAMGKQALGFDTITLEGAEWRLFSTLGGEPDVVVYVAEQSDARNEITKAVLRGLLLPLLLALPLIALVAWAVIGRGMRPLRQLSSSLAAREPGTLAPLGRPPGTPLEIVPVVTALNALLARVARLLDAERRFTADAAHELRTPIAGLRAQAQVALGASSEAERIHALKATLLGCDRASHLVQQLLTLSRLDAAGPQRTSQVDLAKLAQSVALDLAPTALAAQQSLELELPSTSEEPGKEDLPTLRVEGDEALLRVLLRNLVDNALRYGPPGTRVLLRLEATDGPPRLNVDDSGPGMAAADLARLGERFFRPPGQAAPGSGLGWSIVQRIAQVHGVQVRAESPGALGGLSVQLQWPEA
jgi:two-component system sensor histidine kinase QseC